MSKIVFVNPPISLKERYGGYSPLGSTFPSYGLLLLAAVAREKGFKTAIIEAASLGLTFGQAIKEIIKEKPDYLGITATTVSIFQAAALAGKIKKKNPQIKTIIGGPHVTATPEKTMRRFSAFDIAVLGEGEETIVELISALDSGANLNKIAGLVVRRGKKLINTGRRAPIKDLDKLPVPAWDLLPGFPQRYRPTPMRIKKFPAAMLLASRGCPNLCVFCDRSVFGQFCRSHSPEYVFKLIKTLYHQYGVREILFEDDMFFIFKDKVKELCRFLIKERLNLSWSCAGRVNAVDKDLLMLLKQAGCWHISYGIETGDENILKLIKKNITLEQVKKAVKMTNEAGILAKGFFILGHPTETPETIEKTINFAKSLPLADASFFKMTPLPGSELYKVAKKYGKFYDDWQKMNLLETVFIPFGLTKKQLEDYEKRAFKVFYWRPKIFLSYFGRLGANWRATFQIIKSGLVFIKTTL